MLHDAIAYTSHVNGASTPADGAEIDHRIANNLSLIAGLVRLRAGGVETVAALSGEAAAALLREAAAQIDAVARLHRLLSAQPGEGPVDMGLFLAGLCPALEAAVGAAANTTVTYACAHGAAAARDRILPLGIIVTEAVMNAAKYAHPAGVAGTVRIACAHGADGGLDLTVDDDGVGFPVGFDPARDGGLGLRVIRALARQIGAACVFTSGGLGARVTLALPATT
ncbi:MAG: sensor histidine kinase [Hyphomonadaceae bacterium]|nr:sensor histidine kinase [Hyphomonadaceae bacterium]